MALPWQRVTQSSTLARTSASLPLKLLGWSQAAGRSLHASHCLQPSLLCSTICRVCSIQACQPHASPLQLLNSCAQFTHSTTILDPRYEPSPPYHAGDADVKLLQCGVGDGAALEAEFTLYPAAAGLLDPPALPNPFLLPCLGLRALCTILSALPAGHMQAHIGYKRFCTCSVAFAVRKAIGGKPEVMYWIT